MSWNHTSTPTTIEVTSSALARGFYSGVPTSHSITDAAAIEIVPTALTGQYFSISNAGPNNVYCLFGGTATTASYSVRFPPGFNDNEMRVAANENVTVIAATGETAEILIDIAPEVQI